MKKLLVLFTMILLCGTMLPVFAEDGESPLISEANPLSGEKLPINFIDENEDIVVTQYLLYGQAFYILNRQGEKLKEYSMRQPSNIRLPEPDAEDGYVFDYWDAYYKEDDLIIQPVYRIEVSIVTHENTPIVNLTCDIGHTINVYDRTGEVIETYTLIGPGILNIISAPVLPDYVFTSWETSNQQNEYRLQAVYDTTMYFTDDTGKKLFHVSLPVGREIRILDASNAVQEILTVADSQTVALAKPIDQEGLEFYNWGTVYQDGVLCIAPTYGEILEAEEGEAPPEPPAPVHVDIVVSDESDVLLASATAITGEGIHFDEENNQIIINGVALPAAVITWGIPLLLAGIAAVIYLLVKKSRKNKGKSKKDQ
jgi:hypothetical protein